MSAVGMTGGKEGKRCPLGKEMPTSEEGSKLLSVTLRSTHGVMMLCLMQPKPLAAPLTRAAQGALPVSASFFSLFC